MEIFFKLFIPDFFLLYDMINGMVWFNCILFSLWLSFPTSVLSHLFLFLLTHSASFPSIPLHQPFYLSTYPSLLCMSTYLPFIPSILPPVNYLFPFNISPLYLSPWVHFASILHTLHLFNFHFSPSYFIIFHLSTLSLVYLPAFSLSTFQSLSYLSSLTSSSPFPPSSF